MNLEEKRTRLKSLLEENIRAGNVGTAIAITGSWGVGKTYFWKKLLEEQLSEERIYKKDNVFNRKYAYVSLFGLESLSDLKTNIYSNIENYHSTVEIPKWIKGLPAIFKDTKISQYGISAPAKIFDSLMFNQVKDAIICFDDFERMSNKLDIKDVMGLANQLKLEKNCQVILILDEDKAEGDNKKKYAEYKEKLIDETIIINSVEPLIRENAKDMDEPLIELMVKFADELEIHNFRFFQKVIKLYKEFIKQLPREIAYSTKEIILIRILQGYFIADFGEKYEFQWENIKLVLEEKQTDWSERKIETYEALKSLHYDFISVDQWLIQFKNWFEQKEVSYTTLKNLAESELINDQNNNLRDQLIALFHERDNYQAEDDFPLRLFSISCQCIGIQSLLNLEYSVATLEDLGELETAKLLEEKITYWIHQQLSKNRNSFKGSSLFGSHRFEKVIDTYLLQNPDLNLPPLNDAIYNYYIEQAYSEQDLESIRYADKKSLSEFIFYGFHRDERIKNISSVHHIALRLPNRQKQLIVEILNEKGQASNFQKKYSDYLILQLLEDEKKES